MSIPSDRLGDASGSSVSWAAITAGSIVTVAAGLVLTMLGAGLDLASLSPWPERGATIGHVAVWTAIWLVVVQWIASALGGYLTGRLRTRWVGVHTHEVFFRDTAHGFITWALATLIGAALLAAGTASSTAPGAIVRPAADLAADPHRLASETLVFTALSLVIGAFIASISAALGGRLRDEA